MVIVIHVEKVECRFIWRRKDEASCRLGLH
jgi:hypothetical protein